MGRDYYHLVVTHLVDGVPVVQITNPKSGITESIPWHCVMQCTPWTDELVEALTKDPNRRKEALDK
jgi:hypothetical protein